MSDWRVVVARGGVAAVPYLAGYLGEPRQSGMFSAVRQNGPGCYKE